MKVYVNYSLPYNGKSEELHTQEREFRYRILGPNHWSGIGYGDTKINISIYVTPEQALLFKLMFPNAKVDITDTMS